MYHRKGLPEHTEVTVDGMAAPALVHNGGMILTGSDGQKVCFFCIQQRWLAHLVRTGPLM